MRKPNRHSPLLKKLTHIFCVIIGLTFIISGFVKAVDPWGTVIKFEEYFNLYGFHFLLPLSRVLAVWLCGAELMMGCMILFRVRLRLISIFALVSMSIFTIITLLGVTFFPIKDCGCFGDALHLTPWQTLAKNLIILPMVFTVWWRYRPDKIIVYKPREIVAATIFCFFSMGFSTYNFLHLPMIDYLPYKVGVDLLAEVESTTSNLQYSVVLVYRNIVTGQTREFGVDDTEWHDGSKWEWVETRTDIADRSVVPTAGDFSLISFDGESAAVELLGEEGKLNMLAVTSFRKLRPRCMDRVIKYLAKADAAGDHTIIITPQSLDEQYVTIGDKRVECYNIDATTLLSMMRASVGVVEFSNGVITSKRSCVDL